MARTGAGAAPPVLGLSTARSQRRELTASGHPMMWRAGSDRCGLADGHVAQAPEQPLLDRVELETALDACDVRPGEIGLELEVSAALRACLEPEPHRLPPIGPRPQRRKPALVPPSHERVNRRSGAGACITPALNGN